MGFVRTESWIEEWPSAMPEALTRLFDHRWLRNGFALSVSLLLDAGLIMALISLGRIERPTASRDQQSIATFDIASLSAQPQGASAASVAAQAVTPPPAMDPSPAPTVPKEWSVTTIPISSPSPAAAPAQVAATMAPARGSGATGNGSGAGYDPYAFASYQKPDPSRMGMGAASLQPLPDAVARLIAALGTGRGHHPIGMRATVDPMGRVMRAELLSTDAPEVAARLARVAPGFLLCPADPHRPAEASLVVTLSV